MADEQTASTTPGADDESNKPAPGAEDSNASTLSNLSADDLAKIIADLRKENAGHRSKLRETEKAEQERATKAKADEETRLKEQGEFKKLAEQREVEIEVLKAKASKADELLGRIAEGNKTRIAAIPEKLRTLVPEYADPIELDKWLTANAANLSAPAAPDLQGGKRGEGNASPGSFTLPTVNL